MIARILALSKSLLGYWIVNLVVIGIGAVLVVFVGGPIGLLVTTGSFELLPSWDGVHRSMKFVLMAAFWTGLVLWAKEEFFTKK